MPTSQKCFKTQKIKNDLSTIWIVEVEDRKKGYKRSNQSALIEKMTIMQIQKHHQHQKKKWDPLKSKKKLAKADVAKDVDWRIHLPILLLYT